MPLPAPERRSVVTSLLVRTDRLSWSIANVRFPLQSTGMILRALVAAALIALSGAASAQPLPFVLKQVSPGVYAAIDGPEHKAGSNAGFVIGDDGVLVIDGFFTLDAAKALVAEIHRLTPK